MKPGALEFNNVTFFYPENAVLSDLSFTVSQGDFTALTGPNGTGKSTVLKLCVGLLRPARGEIRIFGVPLTDFRDWSRVGYVPQYPAHDRAFPVTVEEVVAMGRIAVAGIGRSLGQRDRTAVNRVLCLLGLSDLKDRLIVSLSGGQRQKVMVARALAAEPDILLLDEPTAGVDLTAKTEMYGILKDLNRNLGVTVLMVSHDHEALNRYAGNTICLEKGCRIHNKKSSGADCSLRRPAPTKAGETGV